MTNKKVTNPTMRNAHLASVSYDDKFAMMRKAKEDRAIHGSTEEDRLDQVEEDREGSRLSIEDIRGTREEDAVFAEEDRLDQVEEDRFTKETK